MERIVAHCLEFFSEEHWKASTCRPGCIIRFVDIELEGEEGTPEYQAQEGKEAADHGRRSEYVMEPSSSIDDQQQLGFNQPTSEAPTFAEPGTYLSTELTHAAGFYSNPNPANSYAGPDFGYPYRPEPDQSVYPGDFISNYGEYTRTTLPYPNIEDLEEITAIQEFPDEIIAETTTGIEEQRSVLNPETDSVPPDVNRSSTRSRRRPAAASVRAKVARKVPVVNVTRFKGVLETKGRYKCEIRIAKKIQEEKKSNIKKAWQGTFDTPVQAARALDEGKYFFKAGTHKDYSDPKIEDLLSAKSQQLQQLQAEPLDALVVRVQQLAKHYGMHGTLPSSNLSNRPVEMKAGPLYLQCMKLQ